MPFVIAAIVLYICAAVWYGMQHDWARVMYWIAAGLINAATLLMKN